MAREDAPIDETQAWAAVQRRDRAFDGRFVTGVLSTGIYCRPSCAARHPARENVRFFADGVAAQAAGLRACKRCLPDDVRRDAAAVALALSLLDEAETPPGLAALAERTGYSPTHFQRVFKRSVGLSPSAFARSRRQQRADDALTGSGYVTDAIYEAGHESASHFYRERKGRGMAPSIWVKGGAGATIRWAVAETTLGPLLVAASDKGVCRIAFGEDEMALRSRFPNADLSRGDEAFAALVRQVVQAVETPAADVGIPLDVQGTAFQQRVWDALRRIPPGETRSYGQLAAELGNPKASRAVGGANGANGVAVLIPCHRVIAADGTLGGYAYGTAIKQELLRREKDTDRR
ncbi:bifunctional DNA-binding transcriptional regulator/O6-methylguanine-DNA methyltransferase Ada [Erythrobacter litoralis]|uniref:bifunctional DNA-binding transcriptional regulator/O6-methylguanine-DNA methyltransferase Ada n=1 Tax=Erythrobacter litoralis TaxID=39960 RepID=UPI0024351F02|nr:bifunctional DNA-binding transcriptional regulator/O6-methylguanine-DNA methyltransferase Ada [Erythrobacter litoralis]MDG6078624.1 bifunctional DNA-binding transcriptional regulator/O6-methylguanine-DNA methyltransferase Ada [Erythrobacter litoralis]